jgi:DNA-binding transcriptional LysR family regulator
MVHAHKRSLTTQPVGLARWDDLRVFLAVVREGSFSAAARALDVEQSTVSRRIAALERELSVLLFDRAREGLRATELTLRLSSRAELIEAQVRELAEALRGDTQTVEGTVKLALTDSFAVQVVIPRLLSELRELHPGLRVELLGSDVSADLSRREADLALRFYRPTSGDLIAKRLARLPLAVLGHKRYLRAASGTRRKLARGTEPLPLKPSSLDWISVRLPGLAPLDAEFLARHVRAEPRLTVSSHIAQVEAVRAGLGVALLTRALRQLDRNLVEVELGLPTGPPVELWLVCPRALRTVPKIAAVWTLLEQRLTALDDAAPA